MGIRIEVTSDVFAKVAAVAAELGDKKAAEWSYGDALRHRKLDYMSRGLRSEATPDRVIVTLSSRCIMSFIDMMRPWLLPAAKAAEALASIYKSAAQAGKAWAEEWVVDKRHRHSDDRR